MNPFFIWSLNDSLVKISIMLIHMALFFSCKGKEFKRSVLNIYGLAAFVIFTIYIYLPFREYDYLSLGFASLIPFFTLFFLNDELKSRIKYRLIWFFCVISIFVIISFVLYTVKIPFPEVEITQTFRQSVYDKYHLYFLNIILDSQVIHLPFGVDIYRSSGIFAEPGHFGIFLCLVLCLIDNPFSSRKGKLITTATILTFSLSSYICLIIIYLFHGKHKILFSIILTMILFSLVSYYYDSDVLRKYIFDKVAGGDLLEIITSRTVFESNLFEFTSFDYIFGNGRNFLNEFQLIISDIRFPLYRFGLIYYVLYFLIIIYYLVNEVNVNGKLSKSFKCILVVWFVIFMHRAFMMEAAYMFTFLYLVSVRINKNVG